MMANGSNGGDLAAVPAWLRGVLTLVLQHGVAVAIALFLVWFMSSKLLTNQEVILQEIRMHRQDSGLAGRIMADFAENQRDMQRTLIDLQLQTCLNTARTDEQRRDCAKAR